MNDLPQQALNLRHAHLTGYIDLKSISESNLTRQVDEQKNDIMRQLDQLRKDFDGVDWKQLVRLMRSEYFRMNPTDDNTIMLMETIEDTQKNI